MRRILTVSSIIGHTDRQSIFTVFETLAKLILPVPRSLSDPWAVSLLNHLRKIHEAYVICVVDSRSSILRIEVASFII